VLIEQQKAFAGRRLPTLDHDDDLMPMIHIIGADIIVVAPFEDDEQKFDLFGEVLPAAMSAVHARCYALVHHVWGLATEDSDVRPGEEGFVQPRDHPDRREFVNVCGSDGIGFVQTLASVLRDGEQPLALGEWSEPDIVPARDAFGEIVRPLVGTLALTRMARASRIFMATRPVEYWTPKRREAWVVLNEHRVLFSDDATSYPSTGGMATQKAFLELHLNEDGQLHNELYDLQELPGLWEIEAPLWTDTPWSSRDTS